MTTQSMPSEPPYLDESGRFVTGLNRLEPPMSGDEVQILMSFLDRQRATFAWKCSGLDDEALQQTLGSSALTLGGMLKHLARFEDDMSTEWLMGEAQLSPWNAIDWETDHDWDWRSAVDDPAPLLYARWSAAVSRSRLLFSQAITNSAKTESADDDRPGIAYILVNMIEEYARHNGHADLIRESIDGLVGQDPPN